MFPTGVAVKLLSTLNKKERHQTWWNRYRMTAMMTAALMKQRHLMCVGVTSCPVITAVTGCQRQMLHRFQVYLVLVRVQTCQHRLILVVMILATHLRLQPIFQMIALSILTCIRGIHTRGQRRWGQRTVALMRNRCINLTQNQNGEESLSF
ncbi:hypothetical protein NP493_443g06024 [Ridgeia piscesae]|uniref:Uncharacterized protein n=1 Tax=Ridgeia piscesae TaxID=27915 RepID=A0AAD9NS63_RIDPI|nr:hypothetical protein NP493_443g06024 [Ridgeia piscesae]